MQCFVFFHHKKVSWEFILVDPVFCTWFLLGIPQSSSKEHTWRRVLTSTLEWKQYINWLVSHHKHKCWSWPKKLPVWFGPKKKKKSVILHNQVIFANCRTVGLSHNLVGATPETNSKCISTKKYNRGTTHQSHQNSTFSNLLL